MPDRRTRLAITVLILAGASWFLFAGLGTPPLWDDEAMTALFAESVWRTGDTNAVLDHQLVAYRSGSELENLRNRYVSPLAFYLAAPFVGPNSGSAFASRLPFAACGLLTVGLMTFWLGRSRADRATWILTAGAILGSAPLFLYSRQCRYYAPAILLTVALVYLSRRHGGRTSRLALASIASVLLLATNSLCFVATSLALAVDYFLWGRKEQPLSRRGWLVLLGPLVVLGAPLAWTYNPLGADVWGYESASWFADRGRLFLWNLRELNGNEIGVGLLLLAAPVLHRWNRDPALLRIPVAVLAYVVAVTLFSSQPMDELSVAFVRYLCPLIPVCLFGAVVVIRTVGRRSGWIAAPLAVLAFGTNVLHGGTYVDRATVFAAPHAKGGFRSTIASFAREVVTPPPSATGETAAWIERNVQAGESVWVVPGYQTYPLMFHARDPVYAWQLEEETEQFRGLPDIHFRGRVPPDVIVVLGPAVTQLRGTFDGWKQRGLVYEEAARIDRYWYDLVRPELIWHSFEEVRRFDREREAVFLFRRMSGE